MTLLEHDELGAWRSPVAHLLWEQGVAGSNPAAPTHSPTDRMARSRFDSLEPRRREAILGAAADEFAERGYAGASLSRIIERAGISRGSLYYYFSDKEDLFVTTVQEAVRRLVEAVGGVAMERLSADSYWDALREVGRRSIRLRSRDEWYARLVTAFPRLREEPAARDAVRPALLWGRELTRAVLARGQDLGVVRRDVPLDLLVAVAMAADEAGDGWMADHQADLDDEALRTLIEGRIDLMRDMLDAAHEGWDR